MPDDEREEDRVWMGLLSAGCLTTIIAILVVLLLRIFGVF